MPFGVGEEHYYFYLAVPWVPLSFGKAGFQKIKGRETLNRSHNDLNTTDDNTGLTESFSTSTELCKACEN
jgi:hypothetical protein